METNLPVKTNISHSSLPLNRELQMILYVEERDKRAVALRIFNDAVDLGLRSVKEADHTVNEIAARL